MAVVYHSVREKSKRVKRLKKRSNSRICRLFRNANITHV